MSITYHVCKYTPTELLTALGGQCALLDEAPENFDLSDQVAHLSLIHICGQKGKGPHTSGRENFLR